ncbi:MAG: hypothetical protein JWO38_6773 [Gemmataceae bacterium]|nr:hypothetical protein [Gemmataceae bacterium]
MTSPDPNNPFASFTPDATVVARQKAARLRSGSRTWKRGIAGAGVGGAVAGIGLAEFLAGPGGTIDGLMRILKCAAVGGGLTVFGLLLLTTLALKYQKYVCVMEVGVSVREVVALLVSGTGLGVAVGAAWFATELPNSDGWLLVAGIVAAAAAGASTGVLMGRGLRIAARIGEHTKTGGDATDAPPYPPR